MKIKPPRNGEITLLFTDISKPCPSRNIFTSQICLLTLFAKLISHENFRILGIHSETMSDSHFKNKSPVFIIQLCPSNAHLHGMGYIQACLRQGHKNEKEYSNYAINLILQQFSSFRKNTITYTHIFHKHLALVAYTF